MIVAVMSDLHSANKAHSLKKEKKSYIHMFLSPILHVIPDLTLGILKMLIPMCFWDVLQPAVYQFVFAWYDLQPVCLHSKCFLFINITIL